VHINLDELVHAEQQMINALATVVLAAVEREGVPVATIASRLGRPVQSINRLMGNACDWTLDDASDLAYSVGSTLEMRLSK
jgi:plasmid maintenance system antidote protein VapI